MRSVPRLAEVGSDFHFKFLCKVNRLWGGIQWPPCYCSMGLGILTPAPSPPPVRGFQELAGISDQLSTSPPTPGVWSLGVLVLGARGTMATLSPSHLSPSDSTAGSPSPSPQGVTGAVERASQASGEPALSPGQYPASDPAIHLQQWPHSPDLPQGGGGCSHFLLFCDALI